MARRAEQSGPQLVVIYWRDIPALVNAQVNRERHPVVLSTRFQQAIDRAAMAAGLTVSHDYVREWRREARPCLDEPGLSAAIEAQRLESEYPDERLDRIAARGGFEAPS